MAHIFFRAHIFIQVRLLNCTWTRQGTIAHENAWTLTQCALFVSILAQILSNDVKMSDTPWRHMTSYVITKRLCAIYTGHTIKTSENHVFQNGDLDLWPMRLWPWPSNSSEILLKAISLPNFRSVAQAVQSWERWQTDTHTHTQSGTDSIPSTADAGGKNYLSNYCLP